MSKTKIIVALDDPKFLETAANIDPRLCKIKIGKYMFTKFGPALVRKFRDLGFDVFLDLKFHDIPNTVADAVEAAADLGVWMINMHCLGGRRMLGAAVNRVAQANYLNPPMLIGVTVLTSHEKADLDEMGFNFAPEELAWRLGVVARNSGLDGVVCSPKELTGMKYIPTQGQDFKFITPGVRPIGSAKNDQARVTTPESAVANGASYIVIGRPILNAPDPLEALNVLNEVLREPTLDKAYVREGLFG